MPRIPFVVLVVLVTPFLAGCVAEDTADGDGTPTPSPSPTASPTSSPSPEASPSPKATPSPTPTATQSPSPTPTPTPTPDGETHTVTIGANIQGFAADFDPDPVRIKVGDSIVWENMDSASHTATENDKAFDTGTLAGGASSGAIVFATAGTYTYYCKLHASTMNGAQVIVEA